MSQPVKDFLTDREWWRTVTIAVGGFVVSVQESIDLAYKVGQLILVLVTLSYTSWKFYTSVKEYNNKHKRHK